jgi:hypothetical protein
MLTIGENVQWGLESFTLFISYKSDSMDLRETQIFAMKIMKVTNDFFYIERMWKFRKI